MQRINEASVCKCAIALTLTLVLLFANTQAGIVRLSPHLAEGVEKVAEVKVFETMI